MAISARLTHIRRAQPSGGSHQAAHNIHAAQSARTGLRLPARPAVQIAEARDRQIWAPIRRRSDERYSRSRASDRLTRRLGQASRDISPGLWADD